jgi:hypothetical protein
LKIDLSIDDSPTSSFNILFIVSTLTCLI